MQCAKFSTASSVRGNLHQTAKKNTLKKLSAGVRLFKCLFPNKRFTSQHWEPWVWPRCNKYEPPAPHSSHKPVCKIRYQRSKHSDQHKQTNTVHTNTCTSITRVSDHFHNIIFAFFCCSTWFDTYSSDVIYKYLQYCYNLLTKLWIRIVC